MWKRRTFYECAEELEIISRDFREAYTNSLRVDQQSREEKLQESSKRGIEILRILALSIRSEQDFGNIPSKAITVGALKRSANDSEITFILNNYQPPYSALLKSDRTHSEQSSFKPLLLREALNKIAHANPSKAGFFASNDVHDLILSGNHRNNAWIAILSILDLCHAIQFLPDQNVQH